MDINLVNNKMRIKALILVLILVVCSSPLFSQDVETKPVSRDITAEMNFDPFSGNALSINYLRFRMFRNEQYAYRMGFAASLRSENPQVDVKRNYYELNIRPGYEKHFKGTERLSPYIGVELDLAIKQSKITNDGPGSFSEIRGAWTDNGLERGFSRIGFNVIAGADFYFAKHFYVGTEFGFGIQNIKSVDIEITPTGGAPDVTFQGGSTLQVGPNFNSSIRLGFVF